MFSRSTSKRVTRTRTASPPPRRSAAPCSSIIGARDIMAPPRNAEALTQALREPKVVSLVEAGTR